MSSSGKALILNQDYSAISVCSIYKAFLLVYLNKAELVAAVEGSKLNSVTESYPMPSVIRLNKYARVPYRQGVVLNRHNIFKRDGHKCQYCGNSKDLTLDHVLPSSRGGKSTWDNLITACRPCNSRKGDRTPDEAGMKMTQAPFKPSFVLFLRDFHGSVSQDWLHYLGSY